MRNLIFTLLFTLLTSWLSASDAELEEKLKAVMILFDKSQQGLREEVAALQLEVTALKEKNVQLSKELATEREKNLLLRTEALLRQSEDPQTGLVSDVVARELVAANQELDAITPAPAAGPRNGQRARGPGGRQGTGGLLPNETPPDSGKLVDLNSATQEELMTVPLITRILAEQIIEGRPWGSPEDLIQLQGFGPMKLRRLQPYVTVESIQSDPDNTTVE